MARRHASGGLSSRNRQPHLYGLGIIGAETVKVVTRGLCTREHLSGSFSPTLANLR